MDDTGYSGLGEAPGSSFFSSGYTTAPAVGTPAPSSLSGGGDGGILASLGPLSAGLSNIGLQWFTASTRGVSGPLVTPTAVQATPTAAIASLTNQLAGYLPLIIIAIAAIFIIRAVVK